MRRQGGGTACTRKRLLFCAILGSCVLIPVGAFSQLSPPPEHRQDGEIVLGLRGAVDLSLRGVDPTGPEIARWRREEEQGRLWPTLSLQGRTWAYNGLGSAQSGVTNLLPGTNYVSYYAGFQSEYNLLQFLESQQRIRGAEADERASASRFTQQQAERILRVIGAYLTLVSEQESLADFGALRRQQLSFLKQQEAKLAEDAVPMIEVVRARSLIVSTDREILSARRRATSAELELRKLTGIRPDDRIVPAFDPHEVDLSFVRAVGLNGLLKLTAEENPRLLAASAATESARSNVEAARSANYPKLNLSMFYGYGQDQTYSPDSTSTGFRYSIFLTLNIPLFDGGVRRAQIAQSELRAESQQREAHQTAEEVKAQIEDVYWAFLEREQTRQLLEQEVRLAEEELKQATARSEAGMTSAGEPIAVLSRLARSKRDLARSQSDVVAMGIGLALAIGRNPFIGPPSASAARVAGQQMSKPLSLVGGAHTTPKTAASACPTGEAPTTTPQTPPGASPGPTRLAVNPDTGVFVSAVPVHLHYAKPEGVEEESPENGPAGGTRLQSLGRAGAGLQTGGHLSAGDSAGPEKYDRHGD